MYGGDLQQSTAVTITVGPFLAPTDGVTPLTVLAAPANTVAGLITGGSFAAYTVAGWTSVGLGYYDINLSSGDTASLGIWKLVFVNPSLYCPVENSYSVKSAAVYGALYGATALSTYAGGAVASVTGNVGGNVTGTIGGVATGGITTTSFATGATIPHCTLVDTLTTYTGNTPQTGDSFGRLGAAGAGLTSLGDTRLNHLDANVSSFPTTSAIAAAVRDVDDTAPASNSLGHAVLAAASAGDPWNTNLPGAYAAGTAGAIVGTNLNATITSRSTYAGGDTGGTTTLLTRLGAPATGSLAGDIAVTNAALAAFAGLYLTGQVSSVTSASAFTVNLGSSVTAADLVGLQVCFRSVDRSPAKAVIQTATQVDTSHVALTFTTAFSSPPIVNDSVLVI